MLLQNLLNFADRPCIAHKGGRNIVEARLDSKQNIFFILVRQSRQINFYIRYVNALFFTQLSAVFYAADNVVSFYLLNVQLNQAVVDKDLVSRLYVCGKTCVINKTSRMIAYRLLGSQRIEIALFQSDFLSVLKLPVRISGPFVSKSAAMGSPSSSLTLSRILNLPMCSS